MIADLHSSAVRGHLQAAAAAMVVVAALVLAACAPLARQPEAPGGVEIPAAWSAAGAAAAGGAGAAPADAATAAAPWWQHFGDPLLADLVARALQANTSVQTAQAALLQARALRDVAEAGLWPALGGSASAQQNTAGGHSAGKLFKAGLDASWEIDVFGAQRSALGAAEATARASGASLADVQVSIAAEVGLAYITLRGAQARLVIASDNLASQIETLQITQWRQQAGLLTALEVEQARAAAEQTRAALPALQTSIEQTRHALAVLAGLPPAALAAELAAAGPLPQAPAELALGIPAETLRQRPDVRAAELQVSAAQARVAQADAARWPSFALGGSIGLNAATLAGLGNGGAAVGTLLASVSLPVFDGGAARAQVRAQQAALQQSELAYKAAVLTALKDVEDALVALRGDRERQARLQQAAQAAGNAAQLARQRYSSGLVDFQTVLETQRTQLGTQDSVASASADLAADHVRLYKALGGGWNPDDSGGAASAPDNEPRPTPR